MVLEGEQVEKPSKPVETCLRGFSYMPETKVEMNLQFIEGQELERTWRSTRRQRLKEREQKIWDEFIKEQDIVSSVCKDDPYQFLEQLPEACIKELLEIELQKMKKDTKKEEQKVVQAEQEQRGSGDSPRPAPAAAADGDTGDDGDLVHIYDDEKDDEQSGPEDEVLNDSLNSPCTVRDNYREDEGLPPSSPPHSPDKASCKSPENETKMIESSIYCAKVRDLRIKINEELGEIVCSLECRDIQGIDPEDLVKMCRRSTEFCARFNRIYMYQLHRQIHDVKRKNNAALPYARHTQFQAQMVRIVSLHQNLLQALQIFHKSFEQTACANESADMLRCLLQAVREAGAVSRDVPAPRHLHAARDLYDDEVLPTCDKLDEAIKEYAAKMSSYINSTNNTNKYLSKRSSRNSQKKSIGTWSKSGSNKIKSEAESRLSMYSLDTLRINLHPKSSSSRDNQSSGTSKVRGGVNARDSKQDAAAASQPRQKSPKNKSPRSSRRPLMRDPQSRRRARDAGADIRTMVESVEVVTCTSSHVSREPSPPASARGRNDTPRHQATESPPRRSRGASPHKARSSSSPAQLRRARARAALSDALGTAENSQVQFKPVPKIKCAKKDTSPKHKLTQNTPGRDNSPRLDRRENTPRHDNTPRHEQRAGTPRYEQREGTPRYDNRGTSLLPEARESARRETPRSPRSVREIEKAEWDRNKLLSPGPGGRCEVTRIVRQLCGGDAAGCRNERTSGAKNAQLLCINGSSPRQPSTPQLLKILEETIQKKVPKTFFPKASPAKGTDRFRLTFNIPERTAENLFLYRTKFVQHMLASPMYANCAVGKPWEMVCSVSEQLIDELLTACARDIQLRDVVQQLYQAETKWGVQEFSPCCGAASSCKTTTLRRR